MVQRQLEEVVQQPEKQPMSSGEIATLASEWLVLALTYLDLAGNRRRGWRIAQLNEMKDIEKKFTADDFLHRQLQAKAIMTQPSS